MSVADGKLKNFNAFLDGVGYAGNVDSAQLPNIVLTTEEFRAGGMDAPVKLETGMEALEATIVVSKLDAAAQKTFGKRDAAGIGLTIRGATENLEGVVKPVVATMRGKVTSIEQGEWKAGEAVSNTYKLDLTYYKLEVDSEVYHEIDVVNMIRIVDGKDQLEDQRNALGL